MSHYCLSFSLHHVSVARTPNLFALPDPLPVYFSFSHTIALCLLLLGPLNVTNATPQDSIVARVPPVYQRGTIDLLGRLSRMLLYSS